MGRILCLLLTLIPTINYAADQRNPYMIQIKVDMQTCIKQNMKDCLKSICIASPSDCQSQCSANASHKCQQMSGQNPEGI